MEERFIKKMVDLSVEKLLNSDYEPKIGYSGDIFMLFGLPTKRLPGNPPFWTKKTHLYELTVTRDPHFEIPYGCYARMNQIFIDTEIKTKRTNIIGVGNSFREYINKLGYKDGRANKALVRQLINYVTSVITVIPNLYATNTRLIGVKSVVSRKWDISFDVKSPDQLMLSKGQIIIDPIYAKWIYDHCAPLDMNVVDVFKRNPLALDFMRFLAYRNNNLERKLALPETDLIEQFETEEKNIRKSRMKLRAILKILQLYWPVKAKLEDGWFELWPSPPMVQKRLATSKDIEIRDDFTK